ncbi:iron (metal) dependent repressor, DtxR family [Limimonas halophila]|uniref:Transcriptional regulator MntR n=1 Tax=Limimonas halophila TaxID=1082479 RepID=A0A1G7QT89_9PROT|nr:manganese-binding transcriptional regulator MntR [Limimonas halophila]SDG01732.1 iron (metal) dependent repressor, DtxR family [Limimonas halophila]
MPTRDPNQPSSGDQLIAPDAHARQHERVRQAHQTELIEDYVELIADLIDTKGEARAVEVARRLGVRQGTVGKMVARLREQGLIHSEPYRAIHLTDEGRRMAEDSRARHAVVLRFLRAIGVSEETAMTDAEGIEHHVSEETLRAFRDVAAKLDPESSR